LEEKLFKLAHKKWRPLSIIALVVIILYLIFNRILKLDIFTKLTTDQTFIIISKIVFYLFIVVVISFSLGFMSYLFKKRKERKEGSNWEFNLPKNPKVDNLSITVNVYNYFDGIPATKDSDFKKVFQKALSNANHGKYNKAINEFSILLSQTDDNYKKCAIHTQIGHCYRALNKENNASEQYSIGLRFAEQITDKNGIASSYGNIALTYLVRTAADIDCRNSNIKKGVEFLCKALEIYRKDEYPVDYAMTQNNLGTAYTDLPSATVEERAENVRKAIECYNQALEIRRKDEYPVQYATTQNNLGTAYTDLPSATVEERAENVRKAIECYNQALEIYRKDEYPVDYAMTIANLGIIMIEEKQKEGLKYINEALEYREFMPDQGKRLIKIREKFFKKNE